ncbi:MAG TPA: hypothetical protein VIK52_00845 [Opitutaceae bacterium]
MRAKTSLPKTRKSKKLSPLTAQRLLEHAQSAAAPPGGLPAALEALWWDAHGDPAKAMLIAEADPGLNAVWVRAYLRRKMGDESIASYLYAKAIRPVATGSQVSERELILKVLLGEN